MCEKGIMWTKITCENKRIICKNNTCKNKLAMREIYVRINESCSGEKCTTCTILCITCENYLTHNM